jgi:hypothetical protein
MIDETRFAAIAQEAAKQALESFLNDFFGVNVRDAEEVAAFRLDLKFMSQLRQAETAREHARVRSAAYRANGLWAVGAAALTVLGQWLVNHFGSGK